MPHLRRYVWGCVALYHRRWLHIEPSPARVVSQFQIRGASVGGLEKPREFGPTPDGSVGGGRSRRLLFRLGHTAAVALPFDGDDLRVVDHAIDERRGGGRVREDARPFA